MSSSGLAQMGAQMDAQRNEKRPVEVTNEKREKCYKKQKTEKKKIPKRPIEATNENHEKCYKKQKMETKKNPKKHQNDAEEAVHRKRGKFLMSREELQKRFQMAGVEVQDIEAGARELFGWTQMSSIQDLEDAFGALMR